MIDLREPTRQEAVANIIVWVMTLLLGMYLGHAMTHPKAVVSDKKPAVATQSQPVTSFSDPDEYGGFSDKFGFGAYRTVSCTGRTERIVEKGDTLFKMTANIPRDSVRMYAVPAPIEVMRVVANKNGIKNLDHVEAGQKIILPDFCSGEIVGP